MAAGVVAGGKRIEIALELLRLPHIGARDVDQGLVDLAVIEQLKDGYVKSFLKHLPAVGPKTEPTNIDDV